MRNLALWLLAAATMGTGGFAAYKAHRVASELVDPPFYHPQPLSRVEATYAELAAGNADDPGGMWQSRVVDGLELWTLRRRKPAKGHVLLLHGFGDDRWGTSPALRWFPEMDVSIFTYRRRDDALRAGRFVPVTFGARESEDVVRVVHALENEGVSRSGIVLMGRSLGASVGLLALAKLEREGSSPLGGIIWEGAPPSSRDFAERLVRGPKDRWWHPMLAPPIGVMASRLAARRAGYKVDETNVLLATRSSTLRTPALAFMATQDRLAPLQSQREIAARFASIHIVEAHTWHLNCAPTLGQAYSNAIRTTFPGTPQSPLSSISLLRSSLPSLK